MRLATPRISPVSLEDYRSLHRTLLGTEVPENAEVLNIARTWAHHPALLKAQRPYQKHLFDDSTLAQREREMAVLRIGWLCQSEYEFSQHTVFGKQAGLTDDEIKRITDGPAAPGWTPLESALLTAVDELYHDQMISDATWAALSEGYTVPQLLDFLSLVGRYWTVSVVLNSVGVQLEEGKPRFPA